LALASVPVLALALALRILFAPELALVLALGPGLPLELAPVLALGLALELVLALLALAQNLSWLLAAARAVATEAVATALPLALALASVLASVLAPVLVCRVGFPERGSLPRQAFHSQGGWQEEETDWAPALHLARSLGCTQPDQAI